MVFLSISDFHCTHFRDVFALNKLIKFVVHLLLHTAFFIPILGIRREPLVECVHSSDPYRLFNFLGPIAGGRQRDVLNLLLRV